MHKIIRGPASLSVVRDRNVCAKRLLKLSLFDSIQIKFKDVFHRLKYRSDTKFVNDLGRSGFIVKPSSFFTTRTRLRL